MTSFDSILRDAMLLLEQENQEKEALKDRLKNKVGSAIIKQKLIHNDKVVHTWSNVYSGSLETTGLSEFKKQNENRGRNMDKKLITRRYNLETYINDELVLNKFIHILVD
jgi:hypothetical protein